jgi:hypothetical protein
MNLLPFFLLGLLVLPESSLCAPISSIGKANAQPVHTYSNLYNHTNTNTNTNNDILPVVGGLNPQRNTLECDACLLLANGLNQTVLHNPKVVTVVTADLEKICQALPESVQQLCVGAAEQTAPLLLNHLGDLIATEGCSDLGICHS